MSQEWFTRAQKAHPIVKIPLQFSFQPVEILSKQLTKLNSPSPYRILYLGPRWDDSAALHKRYGNKEGYQFNDKQINKNNIFFSETLSQNQFYKNQLYYRAFEGMNPTIVKQNQLQFNSRFESGNLDCVVKVGPDEYDLFLRIDSNTQGQLFWFYFEISNGKPDSVVKINICNITKSVQLYEKGFKPYICTMNSEGIYDNWSQDPSFDVTVGAKRLRYQFIYDKIKVRKLYELSFKYKFQTSQPVKFAYCIPYTYSQMLVDINKIHSSAPQTTRLGLMGRSLSGLEIPFLMVGNQSQDKDQQKPVMICIGRLHPGQSNGSHVLLGLMNYICKSNQAQFIRKRVITIFVPMINPDGVILGNSRTGAIGKDLNRQFKTKNKFLLPEIWSLKSFCNLISETHQIQMFLDFHGHSRKKNMFVFGPSYNVTQPEYYRARVFPRFLSQMTPIFRYFGCDYSIHPTKSTTARAVMLQQFNIPYVYAIQTSIGQFYDYQNHRLVPFSEKKWIQLGCDCGRGIKQYFQSIQQMSDFVRYKCNENQISIPNKTGFNQTKSLKIPPIKQSGSPQRVRKSFKLKEIKLMKIFQQIKNAEQERRAKKKAQQSQNSSSDDQNQQDNLQGKKRVQFQVMVKQCIETQKRRQERQSRLDQNKLINIKKDLIGKIPKRKQKFFQREQINLMKQLMRDSTFAFSGTQTERIQFTKANKTQQKRYNKSQECSSKFGQTKNATVFIQDMKKQGVKYDQVINQHLFFDDVIPQQTAQKRKNNLNLRMFNFSKMIENFEAKSGGISGQRARSRYNVTNTLEFGSGSGSGSSSKNQSTQLTNFMHTYNKIPIESIKKYQYESTHQRQRFNVSSRKIKGLYPASFYRIKYQNFKKKQQKIVDDTRQQIRNKFIQQELKSIQDHKRKQGLFLDVKKVNKN